MPSFDNSSPVINQIISANPLTASLQKNGDGTIPTQWLGRTISYSFPGSTAYFQGGANYGDRQVSAGWSGFNAIQQDAARKALATWSNVANLAFVEVPDSTTVGDIRLAFTRSLAAGTGGIAYYPNGKATGGDVWINSAYATYSMEFSTNPLTYNYSSAESYQALIHELGHALGLTHPNGANSGSPQPVQATIYDNKLYTIMSYEFNQSHLGVPNTPMPIDILAIQHLYGANTTFHTGSNTYTYDINNINFETIWDAGGIDTLVLTNNSRVENGNRFTIDIREGGFSGIGFSSSYSYYYRETNPQLAPKRGDGVVAIAYGTVIENIIATDFDETIYGNQANNTINPGHGADRIYGENGIDTVIYNSTRKDYLLTNVTANFNSADIQIAVGNYVPWAGPNGQYLNDSDMLYSVERIRFSDLTVAYDINGHAGEVAKILGAVYGTAALKNKQYVGIGMFRMDEGMSSIDLMNLALTYRLGPGLDHETTVRMLYSNVLGRDPGATDLAYFKGLLDSGALTPAELGMLAANHQLNVDHINLVGLAQTGIEYTF